MCTTASAVSASTHLNSDRLYNHRPGVRSALLGESPLTNQSLILHVPTCTTSQSSAGEATLPVIRSELEHIPSLQRYRDVIGGPPRGDKGTDLTEDAGSGSTAGRLLSRRILHFG